MKRIVCLLLVALAIPSLAFIKDKPAGAKFMPEVTDEQVVASQKYQGTIGEANDIPKDTDRTELPGPTNESDGAQVVAAVSEKLPKDPGTPSSGGDGSSGGFPWTAVLFGAAGFGVVMGLRHWANKAIPEPPMGTRIARS